MAGGGQTIGGVNIQVGVQGAEAAEKKLGNVGSAGQKAAAAAQHATTAHKNFGLALQQASYGVQDFITVIGNTGLQGALIASSNNMAQVATLVLPAAQAAWAGLAVTIGAVAVGGLSKWMSSGSESVKVMERLSDSIKQMVEYIGELEKKMTRGLQMQDVAKGPADALLKQRKELEREKELVDDLLKKTSAAQNQAAVNFVRTLPGFNEKGTWFPGFEPTREQMQLLRAIGEDELRKRGYESKDPRRALLLKKAQNEGVLGPIEPEILRRKGAGVSAGIGSFTVPEITDVDRLASFGLRLLRDTALIDKSKVANLFPAGSEQRKKFEETMEPLNKLAEEQKQRSVQLQNDMAALAPNRKLALDELLLEQANPKEYRKLLVRRHANELRKQLLEAFNNDPHGKEYNERLGLIGKIEEAQLAKLDKGSMSGTFGPAEFARTLQDAILKQDDQVAINTGKILSQLEIANRTLGTIAEKPVPGGATFQHGGMPAGGGAGRAPVVAQRPQARAVIGVHGM